MKILLIGEYSRLHLTLMENLRSKGHQVLLISDGDGYKDYHRDIDIKRKDGNILQKIKDYIRIIKVIKSVKGYDIVQLINPCFTTLNVKVNKYLYKYIAKHNKKVYLGAFGVDYYWIIAAKDIDIFRYSEYHINQEKISIDYAMQIERKWTSPNFKNLNLDIAKGCQGIIACLYEYYIAYKKDFGNKIKYIPLPIDLKMLNYTPINDIPEVVAFFIGIDRDRNQFKGTDILLNTLRKLKEKYPDQVKILVAESVAYDLYLSMIAEAHIVLDQIYSYSPSINPLQAMAMGKIVVSGGEPEIYDLLANKTNVFPIHNVLPNEGSIFLVLENILLNKQYIPEWSRQSRLFVEQNHDANLITDEYLRDWGIL